jgi:hypothetical protein
MDGHAGQFLIVRKNQSVVPQVHAVQWNGSALVSVTTVALPAGINTSEFHVAFLGDRYLVTWREGSAFDSEVRAITMKPDCTICSPITVVPTVARPNQRAPAIATHFAATTASPAAEALLLWQETDPLPPFVGSVVGQRFVAMQGTPPVVLSPSCGGGGTAGTNGPYALGNTNFRLTLSGGDPAAPLALLGLSVGGLPPISCGCTFVQALVTLVFPAVGGSSEYLFPQPCTPTLVGFELEYQWVLFGTTASPCPLLPNVSASDRRKIVLSE